MSIQSALWRRPGAGARALAFVGTLLTVLAWLRLPKVAVVVCFDPQASLYSWMPHTSPSCVSAPPTAVTGTVMVAAAVVVQLLLLPVLVGITALVGRALRRLAHAALRAVVRVIVPLLVPILARPLPAVAEIVPWVASPALAHTRSRRGPPVPFR